MSQVSFSSKSPPKPAHAYLALYSDRGITGISIYDSSLETLRMGQMADSESDRVKEVILSADPGVVVLPKSCKEETVRFVRNALPPGETAKIVRIKPTEFGYETTVHKLTNSVVDIFAAHDAQSEKGKEPVFSLGNSVRLQNFVEVEKRQAVCALGGLLAFLETQFAAAGGRVRIGSVLDICGEGWVAVSFRALRELQVFSEELHPSLIKGKGRSKEGFSLFSLMDFTTTTQGRRKLQNMLMCPLADRDRIEQRHKVTEFFMQLGEPEAITEICAGLKQVAELPKITAKFRLAVNSAADWVKLCNSLSQGLRVIERVKTLGKSPARKVWYDNSLFRYMEELQTAPLSELEQLIVFTIDVDETKRTSKPAIRPGVSEELDQLRFQYASLGELLTKVASSIHAAIPFREFPFLAQFYLTYLPLRGYLLAVPKEKAYQECMQKLGVTSDSEMATRTKIPDWEFVQGAGDTVYFRNEITRTLDQEVGDLQGQIIDRERRLLLELEEKVLEQEDSLGTLSYMLGDLDAMLSLYKATKEYGLVRPKIVDDPVVRIEGGRHLLTEQVTSPFIPNDCDLGSEKRLTLVSGPNSSGKSIYIKQIGLTVIMALAGAYVPCKSATVGCFSKILTKFPGKEAVSSGMSFFTRELAELLSLLRQCDGRSLVIMDEFSRGTRRTDGIALFGSLAQTLSDPETYRRVKAELGGSRLHAESLPCTVATTHCSELVQQPGILSPKRVSLLQMQVAAETSGPGKAGENIVCLYKVTPGMCGDSRPMHAALLAKLYRFVVLRARIIEKSEKDPQPLHVCVAEAKRRYLEMLLRKEGKRLQLV